MYISPLLSVLLSSRTTLKVIARPEWSSPATGFSDLYQAQQEQIIEEALHTSVREVGGKHGR
jgi:2-oxoglutarate dehydrogenase complex dehydrogenase (E1) component-like enzyme